MHVHRLEESGATYFEPVDQIDDARQLFVPVLNTRDWEAMPIVWSPLFRNVLTTRRIA